MEQMLKTLFWAPFVIYRHGSLKPEKIYVKATGGYIYFSHSDRRAIKKLVFDTARGRTPDPVRFWQDFITKTQPDFALDIGVNYGECLFGTRYPESCRIIGCEANPTILAYLERSRITHPSASSIEIISGIVSDVVDANQEFFVDPTWSGTSSVAPTEATGNEARVIYKLHTHRLDSIVTPEQADGRTIIIKMDIEGSEPRAMQGFASALQRAKLVVGFMEFDSTMIHEAGSNPETFFHTLQESYEIYRLNHKGSKELVKIGSYTSIPKSRAKDGRIHLDFILVSKGVKSSEWLPSGWMLS